MRVPSTCGLSVLGGESGWDGPVVLQFDGITIRASGRYECTSLNFLSAALSMMGSLRIAWAIYRKVQSSLWWRQRSGRMAERPGSTTWLERHTLSCARRLRIHEAMPSLWAFIHLGSNTIPM